jgi:YidC/Oxa1 family membrane protein insertase
MLQDKEADDGISDRVFVETDLVQAEFDPVGGTIRSWKLREYTDASEQLADLVRTRELGAIWFALRKGSQIIRTDSTRFRSTVHRDHDETLVRFLAEDSLGILVEKSYRIPGDSYDCELSIRVEGIGETERESSWEIGWIDGLPLLERNEKLDHMSIASVALLGKDYVRTGGGAGFGCARGCGGGGGGGKSEVHDGRLHWFGVRNKYFVGALILDEPQDRSIKSWSDGITHTAGVMLSEPLAYSGRTEQTYRLYLGPIDYGILKSQGVGLERVQDLGPGILRPFSKLIMQFFQAANRVVPNYGLEILILAILVRFLFYPLTKKSMESMKRMQKLKPEMDRINEKYKDDPQRKQQEIMDLYKKKKINPVGACLPMLPQLPILSGLFYVLSNAIQLRKEPFVLWIQDLSVPDTVAHVAGFPLNILPLIMGATMLIQQRMTPSAPQQKMMGYMMPIIMIFFFYSMSSGLVFYWTISNVMTVVQQAMMNRDQRKGSPADEKKDGPRAKVATPAAEEVAVPPEEDVAAKSRKETPPRQRKRRKPKRR